MSDDSGGPYDPEEPTGERTATEVTDGAPLAHILRFDVPFDGILNCGGDCPYGGDLGRLAPVVPIAGREKRQGQRR